MNIQVAELLAGETEIINMENEILKLEEELEPDIGDTETSVLKLEILNLKKERVFLKTDLIDLKSDIFEENEVEMMNQIQTGQHLKNFLETGMDKMFDMDSIKEVKEGENDDR